MAGPEAQRDAKYKPAEVCRLADVQPYVLRYWESEFPFLAADRNAPGPRSYTELDLQLIRRIKKLLYDEGYTIAGAKKRLETELKKGVPLFDDTELGEPEAADSGEAEVAITPFDPDDTGAGSPAPPKAKRKPKATPPPAPPPPSDAVAVDATDALEAESPAAHPSRTPPPIPPAPPPPAPTVVVRREKDPRVAEAVAELKEILAILEKE